MVVGRRTRDEIGRRRPAPEKSGRVVDAARGPQEKGRTGRSAKEEPVPGRCRWIAALLGAGLVAQVPQPAAAAPATAVDYAAFAWRPGEEEQRLLAVRRLCGLGDYEAAAALLPADAEVPEARAPFVRRERARIQALLALRATVLDDLRTKQGSLLVRVDGKDVRGRFVRSDAGSVVLRVDKDERSVPIAALGPEVLLREGNRLRCFDSDRRWLEGWLRWLCGHRVAELRGLFDLGHPGLRELEQDLPTDYDDPQGKAVGALIALQRLRAGADAAAARRSLDMLLGITKAQGRCSLLQSRKDAIEQLARALAEQAFVCADPAAMGIHGKAETLRDGRTRIRYTDPRACPTLDFILMKAEELGPEFVVPEKFDYKGLTELRAAAKGWELIGSGNWRWPVAMSGRQEIEVEFDFTGMIYFYVALCREKGGLIAATLDGVVHIEDLATGMRSDVGKGFLLEEGGHHRLSITHDGNSRVVVAVDGKTTAEVPYLGTRKRGDIELMMHTSEVIHFFSLTLTGRLEPDLAMLRQKFVDDTLAHLWP
jgi:hypothetical protein